MATAKARGMEWMRGVRLKASKMTTQTGQWGTNRTGRALGQALALAATVRRKVTTKMTWL